jgi:hypothetical protein
VPHSRATILTAAQDPQEVIARCNAHTHLLPAAHNIARCNAFFQFYMAAGVCCALVTALFRCSLAAHQTS